MHLMLTNKGPTPLPIGSPDAGGWEALLPPGLEIAIARDDIETIVFGEQPDPVGRSKLAALVVDPTSPLAVEYGTDIDQWKGRSDEGAETAVMDVWLFVKNVGLDPVTITTSDGDLEVLAGAGEFIQTVAGAKVAGVIIPPPEPDPNLQITAFTAGLDPVCTITGRKGLQSGDTVTLTSTGGNPVTRALIDGHAGMAYNLHDYDFQISNLDLTGQDVSGLMASGAIAAQPPDITGTIVAFSASNPTEAAMDSEDQSMLIVGASLTLEALSGNPDAMAAINGVTASVLQVSPVVTLDIDLSTFDTSGLTADFVIV